MHKAVTRVLLENISYCGNFDDIDFQKIRNLFVRSEGHGPKFHSKHLIGIEEKKRKNYPQNFKKLFLGNETMRRCLRLDWKIEKFREEAGKGKVTHTRVNIC
jgi:hypothetical protein